MKVWNDMRMKKWWHNFHFWVNYRSARLLLNSRNTKQTKKNGQQNAPDMRWTAFTNTSWIWGHMHWQLVIIMAELMAAFPAPHWLWECAPLYCTAVNTARKMLCMHHDDRRYRKHFSWQTTTSSINLPHRRSSSSQQQSPRCTCTKNVTTLFGYHECVNRDAVSP